MAFGGFTPSRKTGGYGFEATLGANITNNAPTIDQFGMARDQGYRGYGYQQAGYGLDQRGLNLGYESSMADLGTEQANLGIKQGAAARQPGFLEAMLASQNKDFDISRAGLATEFGQKRYDLNSDAVSRGAHLSGGTNQGRKTLYEQLEQGMGHLEQAQTQNTLSASEQKAQAQDLIQTLNNTAANLNMKPAQLRSQLDLALEQAGLKNVIATDDILTGIAKNDLQAMQFFKDLILKTKDYETARRG